MLKCDHVNVPRGGNVNVATSEGVLDGGDFISLHRSLERINRVNFRDNHACPLSAEGLGRALADIAVTAYHGYFPRDHHVNRAIETVHQRVAAAVQVVKLRLGDRIIHVECRNQQFALLLKLVKTVHARGGFLRNAAPLFHDVLPVQWIFTVDLLEQIFDDLFLCA